MITEIPNRITDVSIPSPRLNEEVNLEGNHGVFTIFEGLPIRQGFQWKNPQNVKYTREPGYPDTKALITVRGRIENFLNDLGMDGEKAVLTHTIPGHSEVVTITDTAQLEDRGVQGHFTPEGNAFFTDIPGMPLYATTKDCTQTILYAERDNLPPVVGLIHAGRIEADAKFPIKAIKHAEEVFSLDPAKIKLGISPSLEPAHHDIQLADAKRHITTMEEWKPYLVQPEKDGPYYLDTRSYVANQFIAAGVDPENIEMNLTGTYASARENKGYSFRYAKQTNNPLYSFGVGVQLL